MEAYSSSSSSSSSSKQRPQLPHYAAALHSVRRAGPAVKPWKKPVAPLPPTPPRVYKVDPVNFRDLVQKLTAAPEFLASDPSSRLHALAPPPLESAAPPQPLRAALHRPMPAKSPASALSSVYKEFSEVLVDSKPQLIAAANTASSSSSPSGGGFLGLNLSPSPSPSHNWCSFPMLSPGTLSSLEQSTVL